MNKPRSVYSMRARVALFTGMAMAIASHAQLAPPAITTQPRDMVGFTGMFATFYVAASGSDPLQYEWRWNGSVLPGQTGSTLYLTPLTSEMTGDYQVVVSNGAGGGAVTSAVARLTVVPRLAGTLDLDFHFHLGASEPVTCLLAQDDGRIVVGGTFSSVQGMPRSGLARIERTGALDTSFNPGEQLNNVYALARQPGGAVLVGGSFSWSADNPRSYLARYTAQGTLDLTFAARLTGEYGVVRAIAVQPDGRILIGGRFEAVNGTPRSGLARLHPNGALDTQFDPGTNAPGELLALALQSNGQVLAGGFGEHLKRFNPNGGLDTGFAPVLSSWGSVRCLLVFPDGGILVGGLFQEVNGVPRPGLARLLSNGALDLTFDPGLGTSGSVECAVAQPDGRLIVGGLFTSFDGLPCANLVRLLPNGKVDPAFYVGQGPNQFVEDMVLLSNGKLLIGGAFNTVGTVSLGGVAQLLTTDPPPFAPVMVPPTPRDTTVREGNTVSLSVEAFGIPEPSYQWQFNGADLPGAGQRTLRLENVRPDASGHYTLVASNASGVATSAVATVHVTPVPARPGEPDIDFFAGSGPNGPVRVLVPLGDGSLYIGGGFDSVDGHARAGVARLEPEGRLAPAFVPPTDLRGWVAALAVQPDGRLLVGGAFSSSPYADAIHYGILRLHPDGTRDAGFTNSVWASDAGNAGVSCLALQEDGKILAGGYWTTNWGSDGWRALWRLDGDGTVDESFRSGIECCVGAIRILPDGKILVAGDFVTVDGVNRNRVARLHPDGRLDATFDPGSGANAPVRSLDVLPDGRLVIVGEFSKVNGRPRNQVACLLPNGALDLGFDPGWGPNNNLSAVAVGPNGSVMVGGGFSAFGPWEQWGIARLREDGSLDPAFVGAIMEPTVSCLAILPDGAVVVGGWFDQVDGVSRPNVARLCGDPAMPGAPVVVHSPISQTVPAGADVVFGAGVTGWPTPSYQWQHNGGNLPGAESWLLTLRNVSMAEAGSYRLRAASPLGSVWSDTALLEVMPPAILPGQPDIGFFAGFGPNDTVEAVTVLADHRILIGGRFTQVDGTERRGIALLQPDGNLDRSFDPGQGGDGAVLALAVQADGKIIVGGEFISFNGTGRRRIARLNADGSVDLDFHPGQGFDGPVFALALDVEGRVLAGGGFRTCDSVPRNGLARLNPDGTPDLLFHPAADGTNLVHAIAVASDGRIYSSEERRGGYYWYFLARLQADGTRDPTFSTNLALAGGEGGHCLVPQPDGKVIVGGGFWAVVDVTTGSSVTLGGMARFNVNGTLDTSFSTPLAYGYVVAMSLRHDGRLVVGGWNSDHPTNMRGIARLTETGASDPGFTPGVGIGGGRSGYDEYGDYFESSVVRAMADAGDGTLIIGGDFGTVNGVRRPNLARLYNGDPPIRIEIARVAPASSGRAMLGWERGVLQQATNVLGPWVTVPGVTNSFLVIPREPQLFFRVRIE